MLIYGSNDIFTGKITRMYPSGTSLQVKTLRSSQVFFAVYNIPKGTWKVGEIVRCTISNDATFVINIEKLSAWQKFIARWLWLS